MTIFISGVTSFQWSFNFYLKNRDGHWPFVSIFCHVICSEGILCLRLTGTLCLPEKHHEHGRSFPGYKSSPKHWDAKMKLRTQEQPQVSWFSELWAAVLIQKKTRKLDFPKMLTEFWQSFPAGFQQHLSKARAELIVLVYKGWATGRGDREGKLFG